MTSLPLATRRLGRNGPIVSAIGLGCMGMSDFYGAPETRDDARSVDTIHAALDAGVTLFNTGDLYGSGHNEMLLGRALGARRDRALISVKTGTMRAPSGQFLGLDSRPAAIKNFCAMSLRRLGVEAIDIYQAARVDPAVPIEDTVGAIADLIREGKVRWLGLSEADATQLRRANAVHPVAALEIEYSLASRDIEAQILPTARELGVGVVAYGALSRGLLGGKIDGSFDPRDFRAHLPRFQGDNLRHNLERVRSLQAIAAELGCSAAQLAIAWVLDRGDDVVALVGTTRRERLAENLGAASLRLDGSTRQALDALFAPGAIAGTRYAADQMRVVAS
jgi:aryl-alcohol dehydrogenase-like predicted oxidoreductase